MEAGNRAVNPAETEMLSLLTPGHDLAQPLVSFNATSAATAQAARMAARLSAEHPDYWPETIRAMMVHSGEWTARMQAELDGAAGKRQARRGGGDQRNPVAAISTGVRRERPR